MFNLPADMLYEIYQFDSFKYDVWDKVLSQFLKGGFYRNSLVPYKYVKKQAWCCRRYCASTLRVNPENGKFEPVQYWLKNIKLFDTKTKALEQGD